MEEQMLDEGLKRRRRKANPSCRAAYAPPERI